MQFLRQILQASYRVSIEDLKIDLGTKFWDILTSQVSR